MKEIVQAEHLKMKRTLAGKMPLLAPLIVVIAGFLAGAYFYSCAFNWWYTLLFPCIMAILCVNVSEKDAKKLDYTNIYMLPQDQKKLWRGKVIVAAGYTFLSCVWLSLLIVFLTVLLDVPMRTGVAGALAAGIVIFVTSAFEVPIYLYLAKKFHFVVPFIVSILFAVLGIAFADKSLWFLIPFSWSSRLMCTVLGILPNGLFLSETDGGLLVPHYVTLLVCIAGLVFFFLIMRGTELLFEREEEKR